MTMSTPYVCLGCRNRLLVKASLYGRHEIRSFSKSATKKQSTRAQTGFGAYFEGRGALDGSGSNGGITGRYSRRQLNPEQLLEQVDKPEQRRSGGDASNRHKNTPDIRDGQRRTASLHPELLKQVDAYVDRTSAKDFRGAWSALQEIGQWCAQRPIRHIQALYNSDRPFVSASLWLLMQSVRDWVKDLQKGDVQTNAASPYQVMQVMHGLNNTSAQLYSPALWFLAHKISAVRFSDGGEDSLAVRQGREELVRLWRLCMGGHLTRQALGWRINEENRMQYASIATRDNDWSFLPPTSIFTSWTADQRSPDMFGSMLGILVPQSRQDALSDKGGHRNDFTSAAIVTWDLLQTLPPVLYGGSPLYAPLATLLGAIVKHASAPRVPWLMLDTMKQSKSPEIVEGYRAMLARVNCEDLPAVMRQLKSTKVTKDTQTPTPSSENNQEDQESVEADHNSTADPKLTFRHYDRSPETLSFAFTQIKRLSRAREQQNSHAVEQLKNDILNHSKKFTMLKDRLPLEVYEHLMLAALSLRNAKLAIEIWNILPQLGYKPDLKTFTVMLQGAQSMGDVLGMEAFWQKMRSAGFQPDAHAWSVRILGLLRNRSRLNRSAKTGIDALHQMGQEWLVAAQAKESEDRMLKGKKQQPSQATSPTDLLRKYSGPIDGVARPTVEIMNAAIAGLAIVKPDEIPNVFSWGRAFGIEPDLTTYNALLSLSMRRMQAEEALSILSQMQKRGIVADSTTWTVLLTALFESGFLDRLDHADQEARTLAFIDSLKNEEMGLPGIDEKAYALIIDRLIKKYKNTPGAAAVYSHMVRSGRQPTAHIYTILMTSYFDRQPEPDFSAIETLWSQIQDQGKGFSGLVDTVFFDRMIEGYAKNHHLIGPKPMEDFLKHASTSGKQPGWGALRRVAQAYANREQWNKLRDLIDQVQIAQRENSGRFMRKGEDDFWKFVESTGILQGEDSNRGTRSRGKQRDSMLVRAAQNEAHDAFATP
ncbi:Pentatricopeptide repeat-containing protein, mitochondrial [Pseudocercospora fuligena]|uniref:Pentatricopeptide repeat-containing protein, mitochondrial n=1 Tax=Pseudocercospora fuligena TaxID=685502 RepID=A0A8H6RFV8_9PEZI|nr:Pentatricopeptide repeat-containing protein, mitochondrial [Pseudocercospora fuligena]